MIRDRNIRPRGFLKPPNPPSALLHFAVVDTAWGAFGLVVRGSALVRTYLPQRRKELLRTIREHYPSVVEARDALPAFQRQVRDYFDGRPKPFNVPVDLSKVSPFRVRVLEACRRIPFGRTASYADLARAAGNAAAVRAAGGAMAHNPLPLVIPCHRVVRSDGSIGGFSTPEGIAEKLRLLAHEDVEVAGSRVVGEFEERFRRAV